eukprot:scaffold74998_cov63-Phaeocystis_antarctica.AAC.2
MSVRLRLAGFATWTVQVPANPLPASGASASPIRAASISGCACPAHACSRRVGQPCRQFWAR